MIHVVVTKRLIGLPLVMHIELLWGSRSFKNRGVGVGGFVYRLHSPGRSTIQNWVVSFTPRPFYRWASKPDTYSIGGEVKLRVGLDVS
jgi:hypothetical protein